MDPLQQVEENLHSDGPVAESLSKTVVPSQSQDSSKSSPSVPIIPPAGWKRCHVYLPQKRRFCRQEPVRNDSRCYCGNHQHLHELMQQPQQQHPMDATAASCCVKDDVRERSQQQQRTTTGKLRSRRVPCPVDPTHWIAVDTIEKHVLICPKAKEAAQQSRQSFYCYGCNAGGYGSLDPKTPKTNDDVKACLSSQQARALALIILATHQRIFGGSVLLSTPEIRSLSVTDIEGALAMEDFSISSNKDQSLTMFLEEQQKDYRIRFGGEKHMKQQASLLGHLERVAQTMNIAEDEKDTSTVVVEVGAGRGMMGLVAAASLAAARTKGSKRIASWETSHSNPLEEGVGEASEAPPQLSSSTTVKDPKQALLLSSSSRTEEEETKSLSQTAVSTVQLLLIERSGSRGKAEKLFRTLGKTTATPTPTRPTQPVVAAATPSDDDRHFRLDLVRWHRISCDLQHVRLHSALESVDPTAEAAAGSNSNSATAALPPHRSPKNAHSSRMVHVVGKHVCGAGTDLSLKALEPLCSVNNRAASSSRYEIRSCIMATCCHGVCSWHDYVGRDFLREALLSTSQQLSSSSSNDDDDEPPPEAQQQLLLQNFGSAEFECMRKWCAASVATRGPRGTSVHNNGDDDKKKVEGSDKERREEQQPPLPELVETAQDRGTGQVKQQHQGNGTHDDDDHGSTLKDDLALPLTTSLVNISDVVESLNLACGIQGLGRACQRLFDYGRLEYLRQVLLFDQVKLVHYVPSTVTPQNAVLVAYKNVIPSSSKGEQS